MVIIILAILMPRRLLGIPSRAIRVTARNTIFFLITRLSSSVIPVTLIDNISSIPNILNINTIIQSAISPPIIEIKKLKEEIKQFKAL
jgi:hypothetical protein